MFVPVVGEFQEYNFTALVAGATQARQVGQYIATSGVRSGALVVRRGAYTVGAAASIEISVFAAWQDAVGALAVDETDLVARIIIGTGTSSDPTVLLRADFESPLATPGVIVRVTGKMTGSAVTLEADLSIALELLPT